MGNTPIDYFFIAESGLREIYNHLQKDKSKKKSEFYNSINSLQKKLTNKFSDQFLLKNYFSYIFKKPEEPYLPAIKKILQKRVAVLIKNLRQDKQFILDLAQQRIKKGCHIFTFNYSPLIREILLYSSKKKNFLVLNTESQPDKGGLLLAKELSSHNIPVECYLDKALLQSLERADIILLEPKILFPKGDSLQNIGTGIILRIAKEFGIPLYNISHLLNYSSSKNIFEKEKKSEIHKIKNLLLKQPSYELIQSNKIKNIISERGVFNSNEISEEIKRSYPWIH